MFTAAAKPADDAVISLHMAALADVLASLNDDFARYDNPMDVLIAHEVSYWRRIVEARGEYFDENLMRTLVVVQAVTGAKKLNNAQAAVAAGFDVHHSGFPDAAPNDRRTRTQQTAFLHVLASRLQLPRLAPADHDLLWQRLATR